MNPVYPTPNTPPAPMPETPKRPPAEKRYKGLIIGVQVYSILTFIGVILVFAWTVRQSSLRAQEEMDQILQSIEDVPTDVAVDYASDNYDIDLQESANDLQYEQIELNTPDTTTNRYAIMSVMNYIKENTDNICLELRTLKTSFEDTLTYADDSWETSEQYFIESGRAKELRTKMYVYRENIISRLASVSLGNEYSLRSSLPIDDPDASSYVTNFDEEEFGYSPSTVKSYLHDLELQVRTFESTALNQFPQTYSSDY